MTYKEKLMEDRPDLVKNKFAGGCFGCPGAYYKGAPISDMGCKTTCDACWNSEMPESLYPSSATAILTIDLGPNDKLTNFRLAEAVCNLCELYEGLDASTVSCMLGDQARFDAVLSLKGD